MTTIVSVLLGLANMAAQGSILNLVTVPKTWVGPLTVVATFLTGVGSFLATAVQPWTGSTAFYALAFGLFGLFGGSLPAFSLHAHTVLPQQLRTVRAKAVAAVLLCVGVPTAVGVAASACTPAQSAELSQVEGIVLGDLKAGKTKADVLKDVANALAGKPGVDAAQVLLDALTTLIDLGYLPPNLLATASTMRAEIQSRP